MQIHIQKAKWKVLRRFENKQIKPCVNSWMYLGILDLLQGTNKKDVIQNIQEESW